MMFTAAVNLILCAAIGLISICRLDLIKGDVLLRVKIQYVLLPVACAASALSPWVWDFPGWAQVFFTGVVLYMLVSDTYQWRKGPPVDSYHGELR